jgi:aminopeptidase N
LILPRVYARSDDVGKTLYALDNSAKFLKELERYAKYEYELPKVYSAAIPDFSAGAMENWVSFFLFTMVNNNNIILFERVSLPTKSNI